MPPARVEAESISQGDGGDLLKHGEPTTGEEEELSPLDDEAEAKTHGEARELLTPGEAA